MKRKTDATNGLTYTYEYADGTKVNLRAGINGVTEEMICLLKREDNRAYEKELDAHSRKMTPQEKADWQTEHPDEMAPRIYYPSFDYESPDGEAFTETSIYHTMIREDGPSDDIDRLYELIEQMPPKRKQVMILHLEGYKQSEIAKKLGISTSTVRDHVNDAKKFIKKNFHLPA